MNGWNSNFVRDREYKLILIRPAYFKSTVIDGRVHHSHEQRIGLNGSGLITPK